MFRGKELGEIIPFPVLTPWYKLEIFLYRSFESEVRRTRSKVSWRVKRDSNPAELRLDLISKFESSLAIVSFPV